MELQDKLEDFAKLGVSVAAVSANSREAAEQSAEEWGLDRLTLGYGLPIEEARAWGLFVSNAIKETEPPQFVEPGLFFIRGDQTLYASIVQTMPFARPSAEQLLSTLSWIIENDYLARGEG